MPETLEYCGCRFRVLQHTKKTCVDTRISAFLTRAFSAKDVLLLEGIRCSGRIHDDCQRLCMVLWKAAWLRAVEPKEPAAEVSRRDLKKLDSRLKTKFRPPEGSGRQSRTPVDNLGLQPDKTARVESIGEVEATLDTKGRNLRHRTCGILREGAPSANSARPDDMRVRRRKEERGSNRSRRSGSCLGAGRSEAVLGVTSSISANFDLNESIPWRMAS
jgi:hypothetical protein